MAGWTVVLSGGGSKGAFEVGALWFLSRDRDFLPDGLVGASAGALTSVMLAQAGTPTGFTEVLAAYRAGLLRVRDPHDVFARADWLERYAGTSLGRTLDGFLEGRGRPALPLDPSLEYDPLAHDHHRRMRHAIWSEASHILRHPVITLEFGHDLAKVPSHVMTLDPLERMFTGQVDGPLPVVDEAAVAASGRTLRMVVTTLGSGDALVVDEHGLFRHEYDDSLVEHLPRIGPIQGALASASIPMVFPPRPVGDEALIDGGVLRNLPIEAAVRAGAQDIIAILATPLSETATLEGLNSPGMAQMQLKVLTATMRDGQLRSLRSPRTEDSVLKVIEPSVDVIGPLEVDPELVGIDMDYGWMRAAEVMLGDPDRMLLSRAASDRITVARERCFYLERMNDSLTPGRRGRSEREAVVAAHARAVDAIKENSDSWADEGLPLPPGFESWGMRPTALSG